MDNLINSAIYHMKFAFIIQARLGSTRLPGKILLPFYKNRSILDLLIEKLQQVPEAKVILATSVSPLNDELEAFARAKNCEVYRGDETDVLKRFIDAAEKYGVEQIIRVCSDNPFLELASIRRLLAAVEKEPSYDYVSFQVGGTPSIKTHYGFWTEYVTLEALKMVYETTTDPLYHEHVTNYIYTHPESFKIKWLDVPNELEKHSDIRLTIDTQHDFETASKIYADLVSHVSYPCIGDIVEYLDQHKAYYQLMKKEISLNSK